MNEDALEALKALKKKESYVVDELTIETIYNNTDVIIKRIYVYLLNLSLFLRYFPEKFKQASVMPLHKKRDIKNIDK